MPSVKIVLSLTIYLLLSAACAGQYSKYIRLTSKSDSRIKDALELPNSDLIVIGQHFTYTDSITIPNMVLLLDSTGKQKKMLLLGQDGLNKKKPNAPSLDRRIAKIVQLANARIFILGNHRNSSSELGLWIIEIDTNLKVIDEKILTDYPISNSYHLDAWAVDNQILVACATSETISKEQWSNNMQGDMRVLLIDQDYQLTKCWKHFCKDPKDAKESVTFVDAAYGRDTLYIASTRQLRHSLDYQDTIPSIIYHEIHCISLNDKQAPCIFSSQALGSPLAIAKAPFGCYFIGHEKQKKKYQPRNELSSSFIHLSPSGEIIKEFQLKNKFISRGILVDADRLTIYGDANCPRGNYRVIQHYSIAGDFIAEDNSFCDYNKETVEMWRMANGQLAQIYIDYGWFLQIN
jgi:hypothetical protein